jgi:hypothetical protein
LTTGAVGLLGLGTEGLAAVVIGLLEGPGVAVLAVLEAADELAAGGSKK